ncbi:hypothetical protein EI555_007705 [Monodon monoceros]|uniref:Interleukin-22 n=1 Tax=Monodon monoceros TaxID=40151 RepID=A0A4U1FBH0_MONMO|nr:hypothetical protein EI555_007705 [Monodon monoceros]
MAARQKSMSSSLMGTLVASCLLLMALWVQGGEAVPIVSQCRLDRANFQQPYITNRTFALAHEASLADNNTDVRLIGTKLFQGVKEVVPFLARLNKKLGQCHMECDNQNIQRNVQNLKDTVKKLGESGEIKVIGELNLLFMALKNECTRPGQSSEMDN